MEAKKRRLFNIIALALIGAGLLCFAYPLAANIFDYFRQSATVEQTRSAWGELTEAEVDTELILAERYNEQLFALQERRFASNPDEIEEPEEPLGADERGEPEPVDSAGWLAEESGGMAGESSGGQPAAPRVLYDDVFRRFPVFATLKIPAIAIDGLPVYKSVTDEVLLRGVGHLPNTSFPVGGLNTHAVLTAHSGLIDKILFTNLEQMKIGDVFYVDTLGRHLAYRVTSIQVIEPTAVEVLDIVPDRDLCSLLTCVPIGVNSHRLMVTGERTDEEPPVDTGWWRPLLSGLALLALALLVLWLMFPTSRCRVWIADYDPETSFAKGALKTSLQVGDTLVLSRPRFARDDGIAKSASQTQGAGPYQAQARNDVGVRNDMGAETSGKIPNKHVGRVLRILDEDGVDIGRAKRKTPIRFEVEGLDQTQWKHDTPVYVRKKWTLSAMMALPLSFALPFIIMFVVPRIMSVIAFADKP